MLQQQVSKEGQRQRAASRAHWSAWGFVFNQRSVEKHYRASSRVVEYLDSDF